MLAGETKRFYEHVIDIADLIERAWQRYNYSSDDFFKVVWDKTEHVDLSPLGDLSFQLDLMDDPFVRFQQHRSTFSDFHFQIFHNRRFLIEILNWSGSHVNIHDHDFSGVQFQLKGDSLNVLYDFKPTISHGALTYGDLSVRKAEIWKQGGRSIVRPGTLDPHTVLHMGKLTTSLLIRTIPTYRYGAQLNYFSDNAAHYYVNDDVQRKKLTGLHILSKSSPKEFCSMMFKFIRSQSLSENFFMLLKLADILFKPEFVNVLNTFAAIGENEAKIVRSVAYNRASEFFKNMGNYFCDDNYFEKTAIFGAAASQGINDIKKIEASLASFDCNINIQTSVKNVVARLDNQNRAIAEGCMALVMNESR